MAGFKALSYFKQRLFFIMDIDQSNEPITESAESVGDGVERQCLLTVSKLI